MSRAADPEISFVNTKARNIGTRYVDAFRVRSEFLSLQSPQEALAFFQRYGPFQLSPEKGSRPRRARPVRWSDIQKAQEQFHAALTCSSVNSQDPMHGFVFQPLRDVELNFRSPEVYQRDERGLALKPEYRLDLDVDSKIAEARKERVLSLKEGHRASLSDAAIVNCEDVVSAVRASIFLLRRSGFRWKHCARKHCDNVFEVSTALDRKKIFCGPKCAHLKAVNDYNARKKRKKRRK